jgi:hypothetical protein
VQLKYAGPATRRHTVQPLENHNTFERLAAKRAYEALRAREALEAIGTFCACLAIAIVSAVLWTVWHEKPASSGPPRSTGAAAAAVAAGQIHLQPRAPHPRRR